MRHTTNTYVTIVVQTLSIVPLGDRLMSFTASSTTARMPNHRVTLPSLLVGCEARFSSCLASSNLDAFDTYRRCFTGPLRDYRCAAVASRIGGTSTGGDVSCLA